MNNNKKCRNSYMVFHKLISFPAILIFYSKILYPLITASSFSLNLMPNIFCLCYRIDSPLSNLPEITSVTLRYVLFFSTKQTDKLSISII